MGLKKSIAFIALIGIIGFAFLVYYNVMEKPPLPPEESPSDANFSCNDSQSELLLSPSLSTGAKNSPLRISFSVILDRMGQSFGQDQYNDTKIFLQDEKRIRKIAEILEKHGARMALQVQVPFAKKAASIDNTILFDLPEKGHELGIHYRLYRSVSGEVENVSIHSGASLPIYSGDQSVSLEQAGDANFSIMVSFDNPGHVGEVPKEFFSVHPWKPKNSMVLENNIIVDYSPFLEPDLSGKILYIPQGSWIGGYLRDCGIKGFLTYNYFDYATIALNNSLKEAKSSQTNSFYLTFHPSDFFSLSEEDEDKKFQAFDDWLYKVDEVVARGNAVYSTFSETKQAFDLKGN